MVDISQYSVPDSGVGSNAPVRDLTDVDVGELKIVSACCCAISSLFTKFPDCCGCKSEGKFLCLQEEMICCKPISMANADNVRSCLYFCCVSDINRTVFLLCCQM